jgi:hypothetical protein
MDPNPTKQEEEKTPDGDPQSQVEKEESSGGDGAEEEYNDFSKDDELQCRFYRADWPEKEELVMVLIRDVNEDGAYV